MSQTPLVHVDAGFTRNVKVIVGARFCDGTPVVHVGADEEHAVPAVLPNLANFPSDTRFKADLYAPGEV